MDKEISETDLALIELVSAVLGSISVGDATRQAGLNDLLVHLAASFQERGNKKAAAIVETVRKKSTDPNSGAASINALLDRQRNPGSSH